MKVRFFSGRLVCRSCRETWCATWNARAPYLACDECGGQVVPEGIQVPLDQAQNIGGEMYRLEMTQRWKAMS